MHVQLVVHVLNCMSAFEANRFLGKIVYEIMASAIYSHMQYNHLPSAAITADKLKWVSYSDFDAIDFPSTKCGHLKGAKTKNDYAKSNVPSTNQVEKKYRHERIEGLLGISLKKKEGSKKARKDGSKDG